jgi:predicted ABC-type transport system involved in lysophospholipase L1 biosynthesis ATPase subunit
VFSTRARPDRLQWCSCPALDPASIIALVALGGSGVAALWKIANGLGRFEARTAVILDSVTKMLEDHEDRLRTLERQP